MKSKNVIVGILGAIFACSPLYAQTFSSGSTGADGAFEITPGLPTTLQVPESGTFNFTTVNIPSGAILRFLRNSTNTPVVMLAKGAVVIAGTVDVSAPTTYAAAVPPNYDRTPGPGGFFGAFALGNGFGPGGGLFPPNSNNGGASGGHWVGPLTLVPIIGGAGGSGCRVDWCGTGDARWVGGGGGGAIVIASSASISVSGTISAIGANGYNNSAGGGAGGAIRLVGNSVNIVGTLRALGGSFQGGNGVIRVEAPPGSLVFNGSAVPAAVLSPINPVIVPAANPSLRITTISGFQVPAGSGSRPDTVDLLLPTQLVDPIPMVVQASNIPVGSQVTVSINGSPTATATTGTLAGTDQSSTATLNISGLDRTKMIFLFASVTFEVPSVAQAGNLEGPDRIAKLRIDAVPGKASTLAFLRQDGTEVALTSVPLALRQLYGR